MRVPYEEAVGLVTEAALARAAASKTGETQRAWKRTPAKGGGVPWEVVGPLLRALLKRLLERPDIKAVLERSSQTEPARTISVSEEEDDMQKRKVLLQAAWRLSRSRAEHPTEYAELERILSRFESSESSDNAPPASVEERLERVEMKVDELITVLQQSALGQRFRPRQSPLGKLRPPTEGSSS